MNNSQLEQQLLDEAKGRVKESLYHAKRFAEKGFVPEAKYFVQTASRAGEVPTFVSEGIVKNAHRMGTKIALRHGKMSAQKGDLREVEWHLRRAREYRQNAGYGAKVDTEVLVIALTAVNNALRFTKARASNLPKKGMFNRTERVQGVEKILFELEEIRLHAVQSDFDVDNKIEEIQEIIRDKKYTI
ncbi:hypothetical protein GOV03_04620 [Candidatus Woesearchaeota archaeon]|nr:hypothetical protein [Candidatus Woesearchaeota archaeon]